MLRGYKIPLIVFLIGLGILTFALFSKHNNLGKLKKECPQGVYTCLKNLIKKGKMR